MYSLSIDKLWNVHVQILRIYISFVSWCTYWHILSVFLFPNITTLLCLKNVVLPHSMYVLSFSHSSFLLMNLSLVRSSFIQIFPIWYHVYHLTLWFMMIYLKTSTLTWCNLSPFLPSQNTYVMFDSWMCIVYLRM